MTPLRRYEQHIIAEHAALVTIAHTWHIFCQVTKAELKANGQYLDPYLLECLKQVLANVEGVTYYGSELTDENDVAHVVNSLSQELHEVNEEIKALQIGKPEKGEKGVDPQEPGKGGSAPPEPPRNPRKGRKPRRDS